MIEVPSDDADAVEPMETGEAQGSPSRPALPRRARRTGGPTTPRRSGDPDDGTLDRLLSGLREI